MLNWLRSFEHGIILALIYMMAIIILISTIELGYILVKDIISSPILMLEIDELLDIFGFFLLILIGIELMETIKAYLQDRIVHSEIVLEVALIAIARKVIILDVKEYDPVSIIGISALIIAISISYYILRSKIRKTPKASTENQCMDESSPRALIALRKGENDETLEKKNMDCTAFSCSPAYRYRHPEADVRGFCH